MHSSENSGKIENYKAQITEIIQRALSQPDFSIGQSFCGVKHSSSKCENFVTDAKLLKLPRRAAFALTQSLAARILGGYSLLVLAR